MKLDSKERQIIRELAKEVLEISQDTIQKTNIKLWKDKNSLKKCRPLILCTLPNETWPELMPEDSVIIKDKYFRSVEKELRQRIYRWKNFKDDEVITPKLYVPVIHTISDWVDMRQRPYSGEAGHSAGFVPCIREYDDLKKLKFPELKMDINESNTIYEETCDILGDILDVVQGSPYAAGNYHSPLGWGTSFMDILVEMRGLEQIYIDLYENPEFIHEAMDFLMRGMFNILDALEKENILQVNNNETVIGPGGQGFTDELPGKGFDSGHVTTGNLWGYSQTQEFSEVSPDMLEEFVLPYQAKVLERFGLNYYGCCEPNDRKWGIIKKYIPKLRAVSVSPWANHEIAAEALKDEYVYSWKPNPSTMIVSFEEKYIKAEMKKVLDITKGCHVVVSMRDTETICGKPWRLTRWIELAKEAAMGL